MRRRKSEKKLKTCHVMHVLHCGMNSAGSLRDSTLLLVFQCTWPCNELHAPPQGAKAEADGAVRLIVVGSQSWCLSLLTNWQLCSCWTFWLVLACYLVKDLRKRSAQAGKGDFVPWPRKPMPSERRSSRLLCFFLFVCFTADGPS